MKSQAYPGLQNAGAASEFILVVEDQQDMREYLGEMLSALDPVVFAANGFQALQILDRMSPELIVSDIGMPEMDGFELLRRLRQEKQELIPVLFLTAHTDKSELMQALLLGVDAYLTKPFESDELLARVQGILTNNRRRKEVYAGLPAAETADPFPEQSESVPDISFRSRWLKELETVVQSEIGKSYIKVSDIAYKMAISERTLRNRIKEFTGLPPNEYLMEARMAKALHLLENQVYPTVAQVVYAVGLENSSYFSKQFREHFGRMPSEYL